jgi:anaerobic ribonucleoside-triphosphate reductase activating protein
MPNIQVSGIIEESIVDGPGIRYVIFFQGCNIHCFNCQNKHTWDPKGGYPLSSDVIVEQIKNNPILQGITLSGGEALLQKESCLYLIDEAHKINLDVILYTGSTYESLVAQNDKIIDEILSKVDYLCDGPYVDSKRSLTIFFRGSTNQRFIDMKETRKQGKIVLKYNDLV